jgi:Ca2+-binding RTX toxin-like protein
MANIEIGSGEELVKGTGSDDVITVNRGLNFDVDGLTGLNGLIATAQSTAQAANNAQTALNNYVGTAGLAALDDAVSGGGSTIDPADITVSATSPISLSDADQLASDLGDVRSALQDAADLISISTLEGNLDAALAAMTTPADDTQAGNVATARDALANAEAYLTALTDRIGDLDAAISQLDLLTDALENANTAATNAANAVTAAGAADGETFDGNGGTDSLVLENDTLADILDTTNASIGYNALSGTWTIEDGDNGTGSVTASNGFTSITTAEGITLEAGVASSGTIDQAGVSGTTFTLADILSYEWTGSELSGDSVTQGANTSSIVSVDGVNVAAGGIFNLSNAAINVDQANGEFTFAPTTTALENAVGNVGDSVSFSYDVVVDIDGVQSTHTVSFSATLDFTASDDVWNASDDATNVTAPGHGVDGGNDTFNGDDNINIITASGGDDTLYGGNENDILNGAGGSNVIRGGNGDDTITVTGSGATESNTLGGGAGHDSIIGGLGEDTLFGSNGQDTLRGSDGDDMINGGSGDDSLDGGIGEDELRGGNGNDRLNGGNGDDIMRGGLGDDNVDGGAGADMMYVSLGNDILTGGDGQDTFILRDDSGTTTITDFTTGDRLDVSGLGYTDLNDVLAVSYEVTDTNGDSSVVIAIDADTNVILEDTTLASLNAPDFTFV